MKKLTLGSLFSGIGGFEKGAAYCGIKTLWCCEINKKARKILQRENPKAVVYEDIRKLHKPRKVQIVCGGFTCQDISFSGKGAGIDGVQSGLWSEMARIVGETRPKYVLIENSPMLLVRGLERVLCDLSALGYHAEWECISNSHFGFDHERERIYIIAYTDEIWQQARRVHRPEEIGRIFIPIPSFDRVFPYSKRFHQMPNAGTIGINDGVRHWTFRTGAVGNAVNPTIAGYLFKCIQEHYKLINKKS
jgi:DNA (cytosine-5)-methyltransferase 1